MMNMLIQNRWLIGNIRSYIHQVIHKCTCLRFKATSYPQIENLPSSRVTLTRPFFHTGWGIQVHICVEEVKLFENVFSNFHLCGNQSCSLRTSF